MRRLLVLLACAWAAPAAGAPPAAPPTTLPTTAPTTAPLEMHAPPWLHFRPSAWPRTFAYEGPSALDANSSPPAPSPRWHSQSGEDAYAYEHFFHGRRGGTYLELGALNGVRYSNTKTFHDALGWRGLLVEANPAEYRALVSNRPDDLCVHAAVCETPRTVHYVQRDAVGGIWELMSPAYKRQWHAGIADAAGLPTVSCVPLSHILRAVGLAHIDFLSLDVEGGELEVLRSIDWDATTISVIAVEADGHAPAKDQAVRDLMAAKGYRLHGLINRSDWFVGAGFEPTVVGQVPVKVGADAGRRGYRRHQRLFGSRAG